MWMTGIILLATIFRFLYLGSVPNAISGDELHYAITAKSIWLTGHDTTGTWNPLSVFLFRYPPGEGQAELPYFLHLLFSGPFPFSLFLAKLPFALLSVGIVVLLYAIAHKLFGKTAAIATGLIAAVNPWLVVMGRSGYEATPAMFFYLLALYTLIRAKGWKIMWTMIPLVMGFYSYIATKIILIPFVIAGSFFSYYLHKKQYGRQYLMLSLLCILFVAGFVILLKTSPAGSRIGELTSPYSPTIAQKVNAMRKASIQVGALSIVVNKYTVFGQTIFSKLFRVFSPAYLFVEGDQFFLPVPQSFFYYSDFLFIALGTLFLFAKKRFIASVLWIFIFIGTLPHLFHNTMGDFSIHLTFMFPFMTMLIGSGIVDTIQSASKRFRIMMCAAILVLYGLQVGNFSFMYFFQYPLVGAGDFPMRILTRYLTLTKNHDIPITIYSMKKDDFFKKYIFYSNSMTARTLPEISRTQTGIPFSYNQIHFTDCDTSVTRANAPTGILIYDQGCAMHIEEPALKISSLLDGGHKYAIVNDSVCSGYNLNTYPSGIHIGDFAIERLPQENFCKIFISR